MLKFLNPFLGLIYSIDGEHIFWRQSFQINYLSVDYLELGIPEIWSGSFKIDEML